MEPRNPSPATPTPSRQPTTTSTTHAILPPATESPLLTTAHAHRTAANACFTRGDYTDALTGYDRALGALPGYLDYEIAVLRSNVAACHVKLGRWREAVEAATRAVEGLGRVDGWAVPVREGGERQQVGVEGREEGVEGKEEETKEEENGTGEGEEDSEEDSDEVRETPAETLARMGWTDADVQRIRTKALLRRAAARVKLGTWADLEGADQDYAYLATVSSLAPADRSAVAAARRALPAQMDAAKQAEMAEVMGKLKQLGNGILKPFGLSTDNFQFVKDEKTGGYSMGFNRNP